MELPVILALLLALVLLLLWVVTVYNRLVSARNHMQEAWKQVDVELQRRHELVPRLVVTVQGFAAQERSVLEETARARSLALAPASGPAEQAAREDALALALARVLAVAEAYPQLLASESFLELQAELTRTEDRLAAGRRFFNANVREINTQVETFPSNLVARVFGFERAAFFDAEDPAAQGRPEHALGEDAARPSPPARHG